MAFFLQGHIKALIYTSPVYCEEDLIARVFAAAAAIRRQLEFLSAHVSLCCIVVGWYRDRWPYV